MRKPLLKFILALGVILIISNCSSITYRSAKVAPINDNLKQEIKNLYVECNLKDNLRYDIFLKAILGYKLLSFKNPNIITIIDYSKPSTEKRCFVIDLSLKKILFIEFIAHGRNSGENFATIFSNIPESKQSSLGFFQTSETYEGSNGYSLKLEGLEKYINHLAEPRFIVIHGADYVNEKYIKENGRLGRSWGCPALPKNVNKKIIDTIKGQTCVYIYADDPSYLSNSLFIPEGL